MRISARFTIPAVLALAATAAVAQAPAGMAPGMHMRGDMPEPLHGAGTPADVTTGTYEVEPGHTQVAFSVSHMGISPFAGMFSGASGSMTLDPKDLAKTKLTVVIPTESVETTSAKLTEELKSADWLDSAKFPTATFVATAVHPMGADRAMITGSLTLHGVTRPITIGARFFGAAQNPMSKKASIGFIGRAVIHRSEFGVSKYVPLVSDETVLVINAAFEKQ